jgi:hypothetical protein
MADTKISALPASTVPLAGTEVLPIVQSSSTKQVSVANLTAGRSFDALGMTLTSTDAGAAAAPTLDLYRDSASPAASDTLGEIEFNGEDSAGNKQTYALFHASILSPTSGAEQGQLHFETATGGALTEKMIIGTTNLVINEIGAVFNVRIEGDTDANLFYTDATNSRVGVGTISPLEKLDVVGNVKSSGNVIFGTSGKGIAGTATNDNADAGVVGELISSSVASGPAVSLTTATFANITTISLTAGDWDVTGLVAITTGATTTIDYINYGVSTTSATSGSLGQMGSITTNTNIAATIDYAVSAPVTRLSLASTTTVYLVTRVSFAIGTANAYGVIRARRIR